MPVGIQGCADIFIDDDGVCRPSIDKCPPGSIPDFANGCSPVGFYECAREFIEDDGLCHATIEKCAPGTFPVPSLGCVPIDGDGCGTGTWGNITEQPDTTTIWVDPSYVGGDGDGSMTKPVTSIAAAQALLPAGGVVALAAGDYDESVTSHVAPFGVIGRCPSMVTIRGTHMVPNVAFPVIVYSDLPMLLQGVRLTGAVGVAVDGGYAILDRVHIDGATPVGVAVTSGTSIIGRTLISGTTVSALGGAVSLEGGWVTVYESALVGNEGVAVFGSEGSVWFSDGVVEKTLAAGDGSHGYGVQVVDGLLEIERSVLRESQRVGVVVSGPSTVASMPYSLLEKTSGRGVEVQDGAHAAVQLSAVVENRDVALFTMSGGKTDVLASLVADTLPRANDLARGRGIEVQTGSSVSVLESALVGNRDGALVLESADARKASVAEVSHTLIENTLPQESDGAYGVGISASGNVRLELTSSMVRNSRTAGVIVAGSATADVVSSLVEEVLPGKFHAYEGEVIVATHEGVGDALVAFRSDVNVTDSIVGDGYRAGIVFDSSNGVLRGVRSSDSPFGLVLQAEPRPDWQHASNLFEGNKRAVVTNGALAVPSSASLP